MEPALVLTAEKAAEAGYSGDGPFAFGQVFPGTYTVDRPVALRELGFGDRDEAEAALADNPGLPLEWTDVEEGEGKAERWNHAYGLEELQEEQALDDDLRKIRTHAQADERAAELGLEFSKDPRPTVAEKVEAIADAQTARASVPAETVTPAGDDTPTGPGEDAAGETHEDEAVEG